MPYANVVLAGRYRLEDRLAVGGMGEVWRAVDAVLGRRVAVKLLRPEYAGHAEALARFRGEARHAASVSHPAIAEVYDYGEDGALRSPYLVMELVDGPSLAGVLAGGPLDPARVMEVVAEAAAGLAAAHAAGLVHRDIKPANLLLSSGGAVKITDFGIAHAAGSAPLTRTGALVGTPAYLAPERAAGWPATPASDLYSLGVVAFECLTGAPPFTGTPLEVVGAHQHRALPPLPAAVPAEVAGLVSALTARNPADRPAGADAVACRARRLRESMAATATTHRGVLPGRPADPGASGLPATLAEMPAPGAGAVRWRLLRGGRRPLRAAALVAAAGAVVAGLGFWLLAGGLAAPAAHRHPDARRSAASASSIPAARMATVNSHALVGRPVNAVLQQLRRLGLRPRVVWQPTTRPSAGTVISVQPGGRVPLGSAVTVTAALRPPGHRHGHGAGHGNGNGGNQGGNGG